MKAGMTGLTLVVILTPTIGVDIQAKREIDGQLSEGTGAIVRLYFFYLFELKHKWPIVRFLLVSRI